MNVLKKKPKMLLLSNQGRIQTDATDANASVILTRLTIQKSVHQNFYQNQIISGLSYSYHKRLFHLPQLLCGERSLLSHPVIPVLPNTSFSSFLSVATAPT